MTSPQDALSKEFSQASLASLQAQLVCFTGIATAGLAGVEKLLDLNLNVMRASMEESSVIARQILHARTPQETMSLMAQLARPTAEKAVAYGRHLGSIAASTQAEFARSTEEPLANAGAALSRALDRANRDAPPGTEQVIAVMKSGMGSLTAGYEQLNSAMHQLRDAMAASMNAAAGQMAEAAAYRSGEKPVTRQEELSGITAATSAEAAA